ARRRMGLARGGARGSGSRYRARSAVILRLRLRLPCLQLWLWDGLQLSSLWLWHPELQLPVLRLWLWDRLQLSVLRLWLWERHCPTRSLCGRLASLALKRQTKNVAPGVAEELQARRGSALRENWYRIAAKVSVRAVAEQRAVVRLMWKE